MKSLPEVRVELDGRPLAAADLRAVAGVLVRQRLSAPALAEVRLVDPVGPLAAAPPVGAALRVWLGDGAAPLFAGQVTAVEDVYRPDGGREVRLRGYDPLHRLRKRQPVRAHAGRSFADLAGDLVADLGLRVEAGERGPVQAVLLQAGQTDFDLLAAAADRCGLYFTLRDDVLHVLTLEGTGPPLPLALGDTLLEAAFEWNGDGACRAVIANGWDPSRAEPQEGLAARPRVVGPAAVLPVDVGGEDDRTLVGLVVPDAATADAMAQAELDVRGARAATVRGVADGDPRLRPGVVVEVRRAAAAPPTRHSLVTVTHSCNARRGYVTEFDTAPPPPRPRPTGADLTVGLVTRTDDPERLGRVRAALPSLGGVETDWMEVASAAAGAGKGFVSSPDAGDRVLVLFPVADPSCGVVIGGLYGRDGPPDAGEESAAGRRYTLVTRGGQRVRLDDGRKSVRVEDAGGSFLELSPDGVKVHAAVDLELAAPGRRVVIRGAAIDFEKG